MDTCITFNGMANGSERGPALKVHVHLRERERCASQRERESELSHQTELLHIGSCSENMCRVAPCVIFMICRFPDLKFWQQVQARTPNAKGEAEAVEK